MLEATYGTEIELTIEGGNEAGALAELMGLFEEGAGI